MEKVKSVSEFLKELDKVSLIKNVFYRGHSNKDFKIEPGIYRKDMSSNISYLENENLMYSELISMIPDEFHNKDTL